MLFSVDSVVIHPRHLDKCVNAVDFHEQVSSCNSTLEMKRGGWRFAYPPTGGVAAWRGNKTTATKNTGESTGR